MFIYLKELFFFSDRISRQPFASLGPPPLRFSPSNPAHPRSGRGQPVPLPRLPQSARRPSFVRSDAEEAQGERGQEVVQADRRNRSAVSSERDRAQRLEAEEVRFRRCRTVSFVWGFFIKIM